MTPSKAMKYIPPSRVCDNFEHYCKKRDVIEDAFIMFGVRKHLQSYTYIAALLALTEDTFAVPAHFLLELVPVKRVGTIHGVLHRLGDYRIVEVDKTTMPHVYSLTLKFENYLRRKL